MRVLRVLVGMVLLGVAVPVLLAGALAWYALQHRDDAGAFRAPLETVTPAGYAVVVPDVDALLHRDVPFARAGRTTVTVTAAGDPQRRPLFVGLTGPDDAAALLAGSSYARVDGVTLGRGPLDVRTRLVPSAASAGLGAPDAKPIWLRSSVGTLTFDPADWRGRAVALVVMAPDGTPIDQVSLTTSVRFGWLDSTAWGLLILGPVLLLLGFVVVAWPARQVVYVVTAASSAAERAATMLSWAELPTQENPVVGRAAVPVPEQPAGPGPADAPGAGSIARPGGRTDTPGVRFVGASPFGAPEDWAPPAGLIVTVMDGVASVGVPGSGAGVGFDLGNHPMTSADASAPDPADAPAQPANTTPDSTTPKGAQPADTTPKVAQPDGAEEDGPGDEAVWPPVESIQITQPALDLPTQEMPALSDLPRVPLQLTGLAALGLDPRG
ncbi:hypothetical protein [Hamadaea tsunoensis]|uniref:hypothetical protein n=1 Tax=Hamadaea tsunoensis TaxID=53368 RepID=UPI0004144B3F|nr:hypothetical protein [Hamadaea tsunoensis]